MNGKQYVGLSKNCIKRWYDHRNDAKHPAKPDEFKKPLYSAMRKYGLDKFKFKILEECKEEELKEKEIDWINKLDTYNKGYNATHGGDMPSEECKHVGEEHGMAKLKESDVVKCRQWYTEGKTSREIYEKYYKEIIKYSSFQRMWHGKTWKHIKPEVFNNNPRPKQKVTQEQINNIRNRYNNGEKIYHISKSYAGVLGHATVHNIAKEITYIE